MVKSNVKVVDIIQVFDFIGIKILFVEDNVLNQKVVLGLLIDIYVIISVVNNGLEVLKVLCEDSIFDVVLMDIQMFIMDGLIVVKCICEELKFIFLIIVMIVYVMQ